MELGKLQVRFTNEKTINIKIEESLLEELNRTRTYLIEKAVGNLENEQETIELFI